MKFHNCKTFMEFQKSFVEIHDHAHVWNSVNDLWNSIIK